MKVPSKERDAILRGVVGTDKWTPGLAKRTSGGGSGAASSGAAAPAAPSAPAAGGSDEEDDDDGVENPLEGTTDADGNVVLFHMEMHPKVCVIIFVNVYNHSF